MNCAACHLPSKNEDALKCVSCHKHLHYYCAEYSEQDFRKILPMNKIKLKCIPCKQKKNQPSPPNLATTDKSSSLSINGDVQQIISQFDSKFNEIKSLIKGLEVSFQSKSDEMLEKIGTITERMIIMEDNITELTGSVNELRTENVNLRAENTSLRNSIDELEQRSRSRNIEIQNVTEKRGENLLNLVELLGKVIGVPIPASSIADVHRVAHNQSSDRPKNIVVQLSTKRLRDDVIAACRTRRGITMSQLLGSSNNNQKDTITKIYVNEHLTLKNKILYANARQRCTEQKYKYVWIKNGNILVRKSDTTRVITIRKMEDIKKIV